ncbi:acetyl-CoA acetyltransferase family protein [Lysinibacillus composti]|uniref:acetyl-CoA C-acetyltransferase n=1 Tax=Lysinibacillus composti TaxID=720633 RepID=A0A3N9UGI8_9BACI|nr:acetyl-CoA C-acetyltransferase [Lysinibacillus composti]MBM7608179.1 acetyl-CoA acetyltransferase family protein [Lysinibacillus composti]RQW75244.1 acetyl-CoA C-acetyltransferase [Lysinibacillus composti]
MGDVYLVDGARTAFTSFGDSFAGVSAVDLATATAVEALKRSNVEPEQIDHVIYGGVIPTSDNAAYLARHIGLKTGIPKEVPALTLNRLCGSGLQSIVTAAQHILLGEGEIILAGGTENMSQSPYANFEQRFSSSKLGNLQFVDMLLATLTDQYTGSGMGMTAEKLAEQYDISREVQDEYSLLSHKRALAARNAGYFQEEIVPVTIKTRKTELKIDQDEHIKEDSTLEKLSNLRPAFKKDGTVTAGNSSGINDGAASIIVASEKAISENHLKPIAKIVSWGVAGVDPTIMGIGPVPAIKQALHRANLTIEEMDLIEVNEAFAAQYLAVEKELHLQRDKTNVNGGAIALGHPVGASGTRITLSSMYELKRRGGKYALASLCIGGGQGIAIILEAV